MSKIKKMTAVLLSVIMLVCMFTVPASAAGTKFTLIKTSLDSAVSGAIAITDIGGSLYLFQGSTTGIYRIGDEEIKSWRSTGKLKPKKVNVDSDVPSDVLYPDGLFDYFSDNGYAVSQCWENGYNVLKYDKSSNKITSVYSSKILPGVTNDGYISVYVYEDRVLKIISPSGKIIKSISNAVIPFGARKLFTKFSDTIYYTKEGKNGKFTLYSINKTGKIQKISKEYATIEVKYVHNDSIAYPVGYIYRTKELKKDDPNYHKNYFKGMYFSTFDGKFKMSMASLFKLASDKDNTYGFSASDTFSSYFNDDIAVLELIDKKTGAEFVFDFDNGLEIDKYGQVMVSIKDGKIKVLNSSYKSYETEDGDIFLVKDTNGKWVYIDKNGKTLTSMCDDATIFAKGAKYALVTVNGKTVLIDRKMNTVSNAAKLGDIQGLFTFGDSGELFGYTGKDYKTYLITYKG